MSVPQDAFSELTAPLFDTVEVKGSAAAPPAELRLPGGSDGAAPLAGADAVAQARARRGRDVAAPRALSPSARSVHLPRCLRRREATAAGLRRSRQRGNKQVERWRDEGLLEPDAAEAVRALSARPEWLDLRGQARADRMTAAAAAAATARCAKQPSFSSRTRLATRVPRPALQVFALIGATSELGPARDLLSMARRPVLPTSHPRPGHQPRLRTALASTQGATVLAVARQGPKLRALAAFAETTPGTILLPRLHAPSAAGAEPSPAAGAAAADACGADLLTHAPEIRTWISEVFTKKSSPSSRLVVGAYAYLDGEAHVRATVAADCVIQGLIRELDGGRVCIAQLCSPGARAGGGCAAPRPPRLVSSAREAFPVCERRRREAPDPGRPGPAARRHGALRVERGVGGVPRARRQRPLASRGRRRPPPLFLCCTRPPLLFSLQAHSKRSLLRPRDAAAGGRGRRRWRSAASSPRRRPRSATPPAASASSSTAWPSSRRGQYPPDPLWTPTHLPIHHPSTHPTITHNRTRAGTQLRPGEIPPALPRRRLPRPRLRPRRRPPLLRQRAHGPRRANAEHAVLPGGRRGAPRVGLVRARAGV